VYVTSKFHWTHFYNIVLFFEDTCVQVIQLNMVLYE